MGARLSRPGARALSLSCERGRLCYFREARQKGLLAGWGKQGWDLIAQQVVLCSGSYMGTRAAILNFANEAASLSRDSHRHSDFVESCPLEAQRRESGTRTKVRIGLRVSVPREPKGLFSGRETSGALSGSSPGGCVSSRA